MLCQPPSWAWLQGAAFSGALTGLLLACRVTEQELACHVRVLSSHTQGKSICRPSWPL